jgi:hypothetical protein
MTNPDSTGARGISRRTVLAMGAGLGVAALGQGIAIGANPKKASALGLFDDVGQISPFEHAVPSIISVGGSTLTISAQRRYANTVPGANIEKGASDIVSFRSTDNGATWGPLRYIHQASASSPADAGDAPVLVMINGQLASVYTVGPENWTVAGLVPHMRLSSDAGDTWGTVTLPTVTSPHGQGKPTNGGKGFTFPNGRVVIPGRGCLLYSDDNGVSWTATPQFTVPNTPGDTPPVETKTAPYFINGAISKTALVPWRNDHLPVGVQERVRIEDHYADNGTVSSSTGGAGNNFGFCRYDATTLLMSYTTVSSLDRPSSLYVRTSTDEGRTWSAGKLIPKASTTTRYSDIAVTANGTIVVAYCNNLTTATNGNPLNVVRFDMDWLTS